MKKAIPEPFHGISFIPLPDSVLRAARAKRIDALRKILCQPRAQEASDNLVSKRCDRTWLECYLTEPVEPDSPVDDADSRKADRNLAREFVVSLEKTRYLMVKFGERLGEGFPELSWALAEAHKRARPFAVLPRTVLLFSRRQYQQFRLLERIRQDTGRWRLNEAATLLSAVYEAHEISESYPTEETLAHLVKRFKTHRAQHQKARLKQP